MKKTYLVVECDADQPTYRAFTTPAKAFDFIKGRTHGTLEVRATDGTGAWGDVLTGWDGSVSLLVTATFDPQDEEEDEREETTWELVVLALDTGEADCAPAR